MTTVPTHRLPDWPTRLGALIAQRRTVPFAWGTHDCVIFAADAVLACTGVDLASDMRGRYSTTAQADELLARHGGVVALAVERLGPVIRTAMAQPGDIGVASVDHQHRLCVCGGGHWLAPGPDGLVSLPDDRVLRAWRITVGTDHG